MKHYLSAWTMKYKHDSDLASLLQSSKIRHPSEFMMNHLIFPWNLYVHCLLLQLFPSRRGIADSLKYHHYLLSRFVRENWAQQLIKLPCACPTQSDISTHLETETQPAVNSKLSLHVNLSILMTLWVRVLQVNRRKVMDFLTYRSNDFIASLYTSAQHFLLNLV